MDYDIVPFTPQSTLLYDAVRVYATVWQRDAEESLLFFRKFASLPDFVAFIARREKQVVGMAFGTASLPGQWWHDKVAARVGEGHPAFQRAWVLTELAVLQSCRNQGVGAALHDRIVVAQPMPNLLLSTQVDNVGARRFYARRQWRILHAGFAFIQGNTQYVILHKHIKH